MKKIFIFAITFLMVFTCSLTAFAAEESVPFIGGGALVPDESTTLLTDEERQLRETAYNEILALSKTDENIAEVRLSKDGRWVFLKLSGDPETLEHMTLEKEYSRKFSQYTAFLMITDDIDRIEEHFASNGDPVAGGAEGGNTVGGTDVPGGPNYYLWIIGVLGIMLLGTAFMLVRGRIRILASQTTGGNIITQNAAISKKDTIFAVKQNEVAPDDKVFDSVLKKIEKTDK